MSDDNKELSFNIVTKTDVGPVKETEEAFDGVTEAAKRTGEEAKKAAAGLAKTSDQAKEAAHSSGELAHGISEAGHHFHEAAGAGHALNEALHGNVGALGHLGVAMKALATLIKTNLIGALVVLGGIAAQVIIPIVKGFDDAKKRIEEAAKAAEVLAKTNLDSLQRELGSAGVAADDLRKKFEGANAAKERLDNAEKAARLAEVRSNLKLSEVDKAKAESSINEEFRVRDERRRLDSEKNKVEVAERKLKATEDAAINPQRDAEEAAARFNELKAKRQPFDELQGLRELQRDKLNAGDAAGAFEIGKEVNALQLKLKGKEFPSIEEIAGAKARLATAQEPANAAQRAIADAEGGVRNARGDLEIEQTTQQRQSSLVQRERAADLRAGLTAARAKDVDRANELRTAREKFTSAGNDQVRLQQELAQLKDEQLRRPGLSDDPANKDIAEAIEKKKAEINNAAKEVVAGKSAFDLLSKDAPKSLLNESLKPALDASKLKTETDKETKAAILELVGAIRENTAAVKSSQSSAVPAESSGRGMVNGVPVADAVAAADDGTKFITKNSAELVAAQERNAQAYAGALRSQKKAIDKTTSQVINQRETQ